MDVSGIDNFLKNLLLMYLDTDDKHRDFFALSRVVFLRQKKIKIQNMEQRC